MDVLPQFNFKDMSPDARVLIIGDKKVGKTSLLKYILECMASHLVSCDVYGPVRIHKKHEYVRMYPHAVLHDEVDDELPLDAEGPKGFLFDDIDVKDIPETLKTCDDHFIGVTGRSPHIWQLRDKLDPTVVCVFHSKTHGSEIIHKTVVQELLPGTSVDVVDDLDTNECLVFAFGSLYKFKAPVSATMP